MTFTEENCFTEASSTEGGLMNSPETLYFTWSIFHKLITSSMLVALVWYAFVQWLDLQRSQFDNILLNCFGLCMTQSVFLSFSLSVFTFSLFFVTWSTHDLTSGWPFNLSRTLCIAKPVQSCRSIFSAASVLCESPSLGRWKAKQLNGSITGYLKIYWRSLSYKVCLRFKDYTPPLLFTWHALMARLTPMICLHSALVFLWISILYVSNFSTLSDRMWTCANHPH